MSAPSRRFLRATILGILLVVAGALKGAATKSGSFVIRGVLAGHDGVPLEQPSPSISVTAYPVSKDQERSSAINIQRQDVPKVQKLRLIVQVEAAPLRLQKDGKDILIDAATAPAIMSLGKVTIGPSPQN